MKPQESQGKITIDFTIEEYKAFTDTLQELNKFKWEKVKLEAERTTNELKNRLQKDVFLRKAE